jgi:hypothetical protein
VQDLFGVTSKWYSHSGAFDVRRFVKASQIVMPLLVITREGK